jgi:hypothetical protein
MPPSQAVQRRAAHDERITDGESLGPFDGRLHAIFGWDAGMQLHERPCCIDGVIVCESERFWCSHGGCVAFTVGQPQ